MAEPILVTGKRISDMELVTVVVGTEKIPTGQAGDLAITPNQISDHTIIRGDLVSQEDLSQVEVSLGTQITDLENDVASADNSIRGLIAAEEAARITKDSELQQGLADEAALRIAADADLARRVSVISDNLSSTVQTFTSTEAGVNPVTGVTDGAYFNVRSSSDESYIDEYQNVGGNAFSTGKSYPSGSYVENIADHVALPFKAGKSYALYERVQLNNGDIVKSTIDGNTNDPNVNMTGWVKVNSAGQIWDISGKNQQEINTNLGFWDGGLKSYIKYITYEALGAKFDGVTDDTAAIQMGNNFALNGFIVRAATSNGRARITSTVTFYAGEGEIDMGTSFLKPDRTIMTSGVAAIVRGNTNKIYNFGSKLRINLIGPYGEREEVAPASPTNTLRGLEIGGGTNSQASNLDLYIKVFGFRENVYVGQKSTYLLRFHSPIVGKSWYRNWTFDCVNDSGENISFFGGCGFNNVNAAKNAVDIYVTPAGQHLDLYLYGYSQDYNNIDFEMYTGSIAKLGGHNENNSLQPYAKLTYTNGMKRPCLYLTDVMLDGGNDVAQEAGNTGKPVWFEVGKGCVFKGVGGSWGKYGKMQKVRLINSDDTPQLAEISGVYFDVRANIDYIDFGKINPLVNRDFATGDLSRWKNTIVSSSDVVVAPTLSVENHPRLGNALKISSTSKTDNTTTRGFQKLPCSAGKLLYVATELEYSNIDTTIGHAYAYCQFFDINGDEISRVRFGDDLTGRTGSSTAPIVCSAIVRVPSGSHSVNVGLQHFQSSGDFYMGALQAFIQ